MESESEAEDEPAPNDADKDLSSPPSTGHPSGTVEVIHNSCPLSCVFSSCDQS
jgi:hypothetical protein